MTVKKLIESEKFSVVNEGQETYKEITGIFCCDLLSIAMAKADKGCVWVTVMSNVNTLAVASLVEASCIILAEGTALDEQAAGRALTEGITVLSTEMPIFESATTVAGMLNA